MLDAAISILFIGNSLTATNDLPGMLEAMGRAAGVELRCAAVAKPNFSLEDHWNDGEAVYRIRAYETTYSIPRFNNSGGTQVTVLLIQNPTGYTINGRAYFWDGGGALLHIHPWSLAPKALFGLVTPSVVALQGKGGTITLSNDGRYGDLVGKGISLEPATGFSFDTPMAPRPRPYF